MMEASEGTMNGKRRWNWRLWIGFLVTLFAIASYVLVFLKYPITRDVPWVSFLLFVVALVLLIVGLQKAYGEPGVYRGKIAGPILAVLSVALMALFTYGTLYGSRLPASKQAPKIGEKAPEFSLPDTHGKVFTLAELLAAPPGSAQPTRGVLLVFYRGYW
jgi:hypothetical protein